MVTAKLFTNGRSQAVRLPKSISFGGDVREVEVIREGDMIILKPHRPQWSTFAQDAPEVPDDFLTMRDDSRPQEREDLL